MADYFFDADASGNADGLSEANAYDGSTSTTLPDGTVLACNLSKVIYYLGVANTLWVKKSASAPTFNASSTRGNNTRIGPTRFMDGATAYGYNEIIGYQGTTGDGLRADINLSSLTYREDRKYTIVKNLNFTGTYNGGLVRAGTNTTFENCRFENTNTAATSYAFESYGGIAVRCECIGHVSVASPTSTDCVVHISAGYLRALDSCYIEARNGSHGVSLFTSSVGAIVSNNIINVNLDANGAGYNSGNGIHNINASYANSFTATGNIIHNANDGINIGYDNPSQANRARIFVYGNIMSNCVNGVKVADKFNYPIDTVTTALTNTYYEFFDNFYHNCTTSTTNFNREANITVLASDPFVSSATKDFTITSTKASLFGYASQFYQEDGGASGDTITKNALIHIQPNIFSTSDSGSLSLGTGSVGDTVTVSGRSFQKVQVDPIVWRRV